MKKKLSLFIILTTIVGMMFITGCSKPVDESVTAVCSNGKFVGAAEEDTGVLAFKGIPYAQAPVGDLRWQAPVAAEDSDEVIDAKEFGKSSIQYEWHSEPITTERSEDCLTLNVWTKDLETEGKPVMVFFHGGSFAWGGTSEALYNGQYIVDAHEDIVLIICNYRIGMMGFIDLSSLEGGDAFPDSRELGMLDAVESLRWIKKNAEAFGGDPENITIFGESAGSTMVMGLLSSDLTEGLFNRVICESGAMNLTYSAEDYANSYQIEALKQATGAKNMEDLMALSEEELIAANELELDEDEMTVNDYYSLPLRGGKVIPENPYEGIAKAKARGVDLLVGTNANEIAYWVAEMGDEAMTEDTSAENLEMYEEYFAMPQYENIMDSISDEDRADVQAYLDSLGDMDDLWKVTNLLTEAMFRQCSIRTAETHADAAGDGKTYMYYFGKKNDRFDFMGACHASELAYVFRNPEENEFSGTVDVDLSDRICEAWVNFAKTGEPGGDWTTYNSSERNTMVIGNDSSMKMESDPLGADREKLQCLGNYYLWAAGA